ncbi:hypothetical protein HK101_004794 [Irineochytrium annulatum]|nr:hypothetical protein HK101_004794 [Irineochytrium annulatum]
MGVDGVPAAAPSAVEDGAEQDVGAVTEVPLQPVHFSRRVVMEKVYTADFRPQKRPGLILAAARAAKGWVEEEKSVAGQAEGVWAGVRPGETRKAVLDLADVRSVRFGLTVDVSFVLQLTVTPRRSKPIVVELPVTILHPASHLLTLPRVESLPFKAVSTLRASVFFNESTKVSGAREKAGVRNEEEEEVDVKEIVEDVKLAQERNELLDDEAVIGEFEGNGPDVEEEERTRLERDRTITRPSANFTEPLQRRSSLTRTLSKPTSAPVVRDHLSASLGHPVSRGPTVTITSAPSIAFDPTPTPLKVRDSSVSSPSARDSNVTLSDPPPSVVIDRSFPLKRGQAPPPPPPQPPFVLGGAAGKVQLPFAFGVPPPPPQPPLIHEGVTREMLGKVRRAVNGSEASAVEGEAEARGLERGDIERAIDAMFDFVE